MNISIKDKNALVCGSSRGIGKATAIVLSQMGANVTLVSRSSTMLEEVLAELDTSDGQTHDFLVADFSNQIELREKIEAYTSNKTIHILINNTGGPPGGPITQASPEAFLDAFGKHLLCNHILTTSVINGMEKSGYGRIINIISTSVKSPIPNLGVSNTTRGAVASWAKTMAGELGPKGITVNNILPGFTTTGRLDAIIDNKTKKSGGSRDETIHAMKTVVPMRRFAAPVEIANAIGFLASPAAGYITGVSIPVDGGRTKCL